MRSEAQTTRVEDNVVVNANARPEQIRIFVTGGTFDKEYDELTGRLYFKDSHVLEMLKLGRSNLELEIRTLMMIDSLEMTDAEHNLVVEQCRIAPELRTVITHGTDTMITTAQALAAQIKDKTIVLTGAMVPYKFGSSDGLFNLAAHWHSPRHCRWEFTWR